ncbi:MAG: hypothetical protein PUB67_06585 [Clostridiales bacterium]|nr:hypothetical protein [Clostridiales bacterium]
MVISVWDHTNEKFGTSFTSAIGVIITYMYRCKVLLAENGAPGQSIGDVLIDRDYSRELAGGSFFHACRGMGEGLATWVGKRFGRQHIDRYVEIIERTLYYVPQHNDMNKEPFELKMYYEIDDIINSAAYFSNHLVINTDRSSNLTSKIILSEAEKVVVLLNESPADFQFFIQNYKSIKHKCIFVIVEPYYKKSNKLTELLLIYGINRNQIFQLNYTEDFLYHADNGRILEYVQVNYKCTRYNSERKFMDQLKACTTEIFMRKEKLSGFYEHFENHWYTWPIDYKNIPSRKKTRTDNKI